MVHRDKTEIRKFTACQRSQNQTPSTQRSSALSSWPTTAAWASAAQWPSTESTWTSAKSSCIQLTCKELQREYSSYLKTKLSVFKTKPQQNHKKTKTKSKQKTAKLCTTFKRVKNLDILWSRFTYKIWPNNVDIHQSPLRMLKQDSHSIFSIIIVRFLI